jgi:type IV secretory pathway VirB10-like protein
MPADNVTELVTEPATGSGGLADRLDGTEPEDTPPPPPQMPATGTVVPPVTDGSAPPAMPTPDPSASAPAAPVTPDPSASTPVAPVTPPDDQATTMQVPATTVAPVRKPDGWEVDSYQLRAFSDAVLRARSYLDSVHAKADRMQGAELDPQLGTSPVGTQLAKKFDDRLNSAHGLRAMLAEAMKRMDDFVASAEKAARAYEENEQNVVDTFGKYDVEPPRDDKRS